MFPIPFNFPFRKKDGSISTIGDEITNGGGGSSYTLPTASANVKGGVKIGEGLTMDGETLKNTNPTPATPYTLPTASADVKGGVKVGTGLSIDENGVLSASGGSGGGLSSVTLTTESKNYTANSWNGISLDVRSIDGYATKNFVAAISNESNFYTIIGKKELTWGTHLNLQVWAVNSASNKTFDVVVYYY